MSRILSRATVHAGIEMSVGQPLALVATAPWKEELVLTGRDIGCDRR